jgi:hypothetical protein
MKLPAVSHVDHYYWVNGVQAWASLKFARQAKVMLPPELGDRVRRSRGLPGPLKQYSHLLGAARRYIGTIPDVPIWHHLWLDSRLLLDWIDEVKSKSSSRILLICDSNSQLSEYLPQHLPVDTFVLGDDCEPTGLATEGYDRILIHIYRAQVRELRTRFALAEQCTRVSSVISIFIEHKNSELDSSNFSIELSQYAPQLLPQNWMGYGLEGRFVGGRVKRRLRLAERLLYRFLLPASLKRLPLMFIGAGCWAIVAGLTAMNNLANRRASSYCPNYCSSALLSLSRRNAVLSEENSPHLTVITQRSGICFPGDES